MLLVLVLVILTATTVFALTIGVWNKSMLTTAALMGLAFIGGAFLVAETHFSDASTIYVGVAFAFLVYFCYMLSQLVAALKEIVVLLQARR